MTTLTLKINEQAQEARPFMEFIRTLHFVTVVPPRKTKKSGIDLALEDVENGRVYAVSSVKELMRPYTDDHVRVRKGE